MNRIGLVAAALALSMSAMLVGCDNPEKMKDVPQEALPKMEPNPLVLVGKTVEGKIKGIFPPKYFNKKAKLELTPVLKYEGGELVLPSKIFQGEDVTENNTVINSDLGGVYSHEFKFDYKPEMMKSTLELRMTLYYKDKKVPFDAAYKLGVGVNVTQNLVQLSAFPIPMPHNFDPSHMSEAAAQFNYRIQQADILSGEFMRDEIKALQKAIQDISENPKATLEKISVKAYASPDGPVALNDNLSKGRGKSAQNWLEAQLKKAKNTSTNAISIDELATDWDGFKTMLEESNIEDKDLILRVLSMYSDPDVRNREMHNIGRVFQVVAEKILPKLRRARMVASYKLEERTKDEIKAMVADGKLLELNENEAFYAVTLEPDFAKQEELYKQLAEKYSSIRAYNNLASSYLYNGKREEARQMLSKAQAIDDKNPYVLNNLGVLAMLDGNAEEAEKYFTRATDTDKLRVNANLGICAILRGEYEAAVNYLTGTNSFNQGLALLLTDHSEAAKNAFSDIKDAHSYYGLAIIGARTQDEKMLLDNLRTAIQKDPKFKARAAKDVEFAKFAQNEVFASLIK